jgi:YihY family inner membrane protein
VRLTQGPAERHLLGAGKAQRLEAPDETWAPPGQSIDEVALRAASVDGGCVDHGRNEQRELPARALPPVRIREVPIGDAGSFTPRRELPLVAPPRAAPRIEPEEVRMAMKEQLGRIDRAQQSHEKLAVAAATVKKYGEDQSSSLASMIAFWAFFSIFPLFLVLVTILGYVLPADRRTDVLGRVASSFPLLHPSTVGSLTGSWWPILVGGLSALWAGSAVVRMTQQAFDEVWEIPHRDRPGLAEQVRRSLFALGTIGFGLVVATIMAGYVTGRDTGVDLGWYGRLGGYLIALALDVGLFVIVFRMLTRRDVSFREVLPGALLAGGAFFVLQLISSLIISRYVSKAQGTYGSFATVITILWWFYLQAQITLLGAQLNVVLTERLYPRRLVGGPETDADHRALQQYADKATYY